MGASRTIVIDLWSGQARGLAPNRGTCVAQVPPGVRGDLRALFVGAYPRFAEACRQADAPGLALVAVDTSTGQAAGLVRLRAQVGRHVAAIVGRHDACDLFLATHPQLALRHLAVIADPVASFARGTPCTYRIVDLRSEDGFHDEHGRALRGVRCEGAAVVHCAGYALFVLPLGDPTDWPETGSDAWTFLPERVYFDEVTRAVRGSSAEVLPRRDGAHRQTQITCMPGPRDVGVSLVTNGDHAGTLELVRPEARQVIEVGEAALGDGLLLGRYARCDGRPQDDQALSRVHALLIRINSALLVIDTASTYGTSALGRPPARVIEILGDTELTLGLNTQARWRWRS